MRRLRVLIADDERDTAASLEALINDEGHQTRCVFRGCDVVDMVVDFDPHVVLLDIGMPGMNGYDVARALREHYASTRPGLIAVSAWSTLPDKLMAKEVGFDHHVSKPYDPKELLALIAQFGNVPALRREVAPGRYLGPLPPLRYSFGMVRDCLRAELVGRRTPAQTEEFLRVLLGKMEELRSNRVLICVRSSYAVFQVDQYHISQYFDWLLAHPAVRVALVADSSEIHTAHEYVELLARQRGVNLRAYTKEEDAIHWLRVGLDGEDTQ